MFVDGRERGATPVSLDVSRATHTLVLRHAEAIDDQRQILVTNDSNVNVNMWRRRPDVVQLRPTYPGASISDAVLLADGRLALSMALPVQAGGSNTGVLREPWIFDPASGSLQPFDVMGSIPRAAVLAVSPDGLRVAFLQPGQSKPKGGGADPRLDEVWVGARGGQTPVRILSLTPSDDQSTRGSAFGEVEELRDVAWTPDSKHLLVTAQLVAVSTGYPAAPRSRLLLVDIPAGDQPRYGANRTGYSAGEDRTWELRVGT